MKNILLTAFFLLAFLLNAQTPIPLYVSSQTKEYSVYEADTVMKWAEEQFAGVDISTLGLIECSITPGYVALPEYEEWGPDNQEDFHGEVWPIRPWPDAGKASPIYKVVADWWREDRDKEGVVTWGRFTGTDEKHFEVHSLLLEVEATLDPDKCKWLLTAIPYPKGGEVKWQDGQTGLSIDVPYNKDLVGKEFSAVYTIEGVTYSAKTNKLEGIEMSVDGSVKFIWGDDGKGYYVLTYSVNPDGECKKNCLGVLKWRVPQANPKDVGGNWSYPYRLETFNLNPAINTISVPAPDHGRTDDSSTLTFTFEGTTISKEIPLGFH